MNATTRRTVAAAIAAAVALPLGLVGCAATDPPLEESVRTAVLHGDPGIADAAVSVGGDLSGASVRVRVYVEESTDLAPVLDATMRAILTGSTVRPGTFQIDVALAPKPEDVSFATPGIPITDAADELGIAGLRVNNQLSGRIADLEARYGPWDELHG